MYSKTSQVSVEYMLIIGFATVITIPLILIYHSFSEESGTEINSAHAEQVAKKIVDASESVYYLGEPSQTTLNINMPDGVILTNLSNYEVVLKIRTQSGIADIVRNSAVNITGSLPTSQGTYKVTLKAMSNYVEVSYS